MTNVAPVLALQRANSPRDFPSRTTPSGRNSQTGVPKRWAEPSTPDGWSRGLPNQNVRSAYLEAYRAERTGTLGYRVFLIPPCQSHRQHRGITDFLGNSVTLVIHPPGKLTINGEDFYDQNLETNLNLVFSTRYSRTLFILPDPDIQMGRLFEVLDRAHRSSVIDRTVLLTPAQVRDIADEFCIIDLSKR